MKSYSAIVYADTILGRSTSSDYMKALVVAMLEYGAEAQMYFGHDTGSLMDAGLTAEQRALVGVYEHDGVTYDTGILNYSIGKYCEGLAANDASAQQAFAQATAVYGYCAKEYFENL